jgi:hypothetical protein
MKYIPKPLYYYRWHGGNSITQEEKMANYTIRTVFYEAQHLMSFENPEIRKIILNFIEKLQLKTKETKN